MLPECVWIGLLACSSCVSFLADCSPVFPKFERCVYVSVSWGRRESLHCSSSFNSRGCSLHSLWVPLAIQAPTLLPRLRRAHRVRWWRQRPVFHNYLCQQSCRLNASLADGKSADRGKCAVWHFGRSTLYFCPANLLSDINCSIGQHSSMRPVCHVILTLVKPSSHQLLFRYWLCHCGLGP